MRSSFLVALLWLLAQPSQACSLSREPLRQVIEASFPAIRTCMTRHHYEPGRYVVDFTVEPDGSVRQSRLASSPAALSEPASRCLTDVFTRMRFPARPQPVAESPPTRRRVHGRYSPVPPPPRTPAPVCGGPIAVRYPLVLEPQPAR